MLASRLRTLYCGLRCKMQATEALFSWVADKILGVHTGRYLLPIASEKSFHIDTSQFPRSVSSASYRGLYIYESCCCLRERIQDFASRQNKTFEEQQMGAS